MLDEKSKNLIGHKDNLDLIFKSYFNNKLHHSIICYGNKGIGKSTFCINLINNIFNKIQSQGKLEYNSNLIYKNTHPNVKLISKQFDEKKNKYKNFILIEQIRNIEEFIYKSSFNNLPKFVIIDSADDLNLNSANSLLKLIEEPKNNTFILLISHQLSSLLATIRSRCIKLKFNNPNYENFIKIMENNQINIDEDDFRFLFDISNASPGIASNIYNLNILKFMDDLFLIFKENKPLSSKIDILSTDVSKFSNDDFKIYLSFIKFILINLIKINLGSNINHILNKKLFNSISELAKYIDNLKSLKILDYLNKNEHYLFSLNLDKRIFNMNIFSILKS